MYQRGRETEAQQREGQEEPTGLLISTSRNGIQDSEVLEDRGSGALGCRGEGPGGGLPGGATAVCPGTT